LFYVLPIALITWLTNRRLGLAASLISALVWLWADLASRQYQLNPFIPVWNTFIRLLFFLIIMLLLSAVRSGITRDRELARLDTLTGRRQFRFSMN